MVKVVYPRQYDCNRPPSRSAVPLNRLIFDPRQGSNLTSRLTVHSGVYFILVVAILSAPQKRKNDISKSCTDAGYACFCGANVYLTAINHFIPIDIQNPSCNINTYVIRI